MTHILVCRKKSALAAIAVALIVSGSASAQTGPIVAPPALHVVAVGVNHPQGHEKPLRSADKDARDHERFWTTQRGRLYSRVNARPALTNEAATRHAILQALDQFVADAQSGDTAIIALAGHGGVVQPGTWCFAAQDGPLFAADIRTRVDRLVQKGVRVLLIVDTCESGGIGIQGDSIIVLAACTADQAAQDGPDNGTFTKALLEGLAGAADASRDGVITLAELDAYVATRLEQLNAKQTHTCGRPTNLRSNLPLALVAACSVPAARAP
jgi:hypothetical protein